MTHRSTIVLNWEKLPLEVQQFLIQYIGLMGPYAGHASSRPYLDITLRRVSIGSADYYAEDSTTISADDRPLATIPQKYVLEFDTRFDHIEVQEHKP